MQLSHSELMLWPPVGKGGWAGLCHLLLCLSPSVLYQGLQFIHASIRQKSTDINSWVSTSRVNRVNNAPIL